MANRIEQNVIIIDTGVASVSVPLANATDTRQTLKTFIIQSVAITNSVGLLVLTGADTRNVICRLSGENPWIDFPLGLVCTALKAPVCTTTTGMIYLR